MRQPRCGVSFEAAERVLQHSFGGELAETYDVNKFTDMKRDALEKLAAVIEEIVESRPRPANVVAMGARP